VAKVPAEANAPPSGQSIRLTAALTPEGGGYVARCLEVEVASQGDTIEEALAHLREALELYFEDGEAPPPTAPPLIAPIELML
jgi:predicted RNase H-like HicB family nuclease